MNFSHKKIKFNMHSEIFEVKFVNQKNWIGLVSIEGFITVRKDEAIKNLIGS